MHLVKPAWVQHADEKKKRVPIFSLHVHCDGSRLATGGIDAKVRIWSTAPILDPESTMPKTLCTLTMHVGPVLCVRWSNSGRLLASGSDDGLVMIWDLDPAGAGKVFGEEEVNVEGWKALRRLPGHESDVSDLAWSPNDRYLASVSMDACVLIWDGYTFERIARLEGHGGFVKGVCWDPVGQYLATQSDDKSVRVWRTTDWQTESVITQPFERSPSSTFFRRLSWSPDGAHITASNAMNGPVFVAAVISRKEWTSDISLVGHENTIEVAAYNPHIFVRDLGNKVESSNICSVLALGADDRSVSVWQTNSARPLLVARELFDRQVLDLCWSFDGLTLYACSSDGTIAVLKFEPNELRGLASNAAKAEYLKGYNFASPMNVSYQPPPLPPPPSFAQPVSAQPAIIPHQITQQQEVTRTQDGKRRIKPVLISSGSSSLLPQPNGIHPVHSQQPHTNGFAPPVAPPPPFVSHHPLVSPDSNPFTSVPLQQPQRQPPAPTPVQDDDIQMVESWEVVESDSSRAQSATHKKGRTLGGDRAREMIAVQELRSNFDIPSTGMAMDTATARVLNVPPLKTYLSASVEGGKEGDVFEARNWEDRSRMTEVSLYTSKTVQWLDYLPSPVLSIVATSVYYAATCEDSSLNVYSPTGRRMIPTIVLDSTCAVLEGTKGQLMAITAEGTLAVWNVKQGRATIPSMSIRPLLRAPLIAAHVRPNGSPILEFKSGVALSYDPLLSSWHKLSDHWWSQGSETWDASRARASKLALAPSRGPVASLETAISELKLPEVQGERPQWWSAAMTLGHLETRLHAAKALDSPQEYKMALVSYARKLADEGFRAKAEELIKELLGPVYWKPGRDETWSPAVLGMQKRDLLKDVLSTFARSKTLVVLGNEYQEILKKVAAEE